MTPAEKVVAHLREQGEKQVRAARQLEGSEQHMAAMMRLGAQEMAALADVVKAGSWCATFAPRDAQAEFDEAIRRAAEVCG